MSITGADVRHMATLARVGVSEARIPMLVAELNGILSHMEALQRVELPADLADALGAPVHGPPQMPLAQDDRGSVVLERTREQFAPATREGFFLVPRLSTHGTAGASTAPVRGEDGSASPELAVIEDDIDQ